MSADEFRAKDCVQFGCGTHAPKGWKHFDASLRLRLERTAAGIFMRRRYPRSVVYGDVVRGLPVAEGSCRAIYSCHVLEHLALEDLNRALANCFRYLAPGGYFRAVLPDLEQLVKYYLSCDHDGAAADFMRYSGFGIERLPQGLADVVRYVWGGHRHLWMWDFKGLRQQLMAAGFEKIRRVEFGMTDEPAFVEVDSVGRYNGSFGVECSKPDLEVGSRNW